MADGDEDTGQTDNDTSDENGQADDNTGNDTNDKDTNENGDDTGADDEGGNKDGDGDGGDASGDDDDGGEGDDDNKDGDGDDDGDSKAELKINVPEGVEIDSTLSEGAMAIAKKHNIPQEALDELTQLVVADRVNLADQSKAAFDKMLDDLEEASKTDKVIGGDDFEENVGIAMTAVEKFGGDDLNKLLEDSGLGNHPVMIRAFLNIGKLMAEDGTLTGDVDGGAKDESEAGRAARLYPKEAQQSA